MVHTITEQVLSSFDPLYNLHTQKIRPSFTLPKETVCHVGDVVKTPWAEDILHVQSNVISADTSFIFLKVGKDLGFTERTWFSKFMSDKFCKKWSADHLYGQYISLCEPDDLVHIISSLPYSCVQIPLPLYSAMIPIKNSLDNPSIFCAHNTNDAGIVLHSVTMAKLWFETNQYIAFRFRP
jgi:hypothetical protein